ncbi:MAG: hypothetical protein GU356_08175 [Pyrobaculum sp.]|nr:hypothetical protein [Pyrobaculum sp.]
MRAAGTSHSALGNQVAAVENQLHCGSSSPRRLHTPPRSRLLTYLVDGVAV